MVLAALRAGASATAAAEAVGVSERLLATTARADGELRAALDGRPVAVQAIARRADWLTALTRLGGDQTAAAYAIGITPSQPKKWRWEDPAFDAVVVALLAWIAKGGVRRNRVLPVDEQRLEKAADHLEQGASIADAARLTGMAAATLRKRAPDCPRLAAALAARKRSSITDVKLTAAARHLEQGASLGRAAQMAEIAVGELIAHAPGHDRLQAALTAYREKQPDHP
ncbi:hypothetical protein [Streptomyces sp. NBC_01789]|uniref:hypothetical protein n=1 Tax=Streptomyces sp. NBC_01789 TaxID=2975941 RepID=UPI002257D3E0|nr:hypothetical protein [Streptomyces sp. NBC_01789]MCX4451628.1 hypothetical protein [Streptomyces sp. NBC_01789]